MQEDKRVLYPVKGQDGVLKGYMFFCPGCKFAHMFYVVGKVVWTFNGDMDKPTVSPSLLVNSHDAASRCHLHLRNGVIEYCSDCHHDLKGKHVPLEPF